MAARFSDLSIYLNVTDAGMTARGCEESDALSQSCAVRLCIFRRGERPRSTVAFESHPDEQKTAKYAAQTFWTLVAG